jgi:hypothetical protein
MPRELLATLLNGTLAAEELLDGNDEVRVPVTNSLRAQSPKYSPRWRTVPPTGQSHVRWESPSTSPSFHVAAILAKLNAESRTEAVKRAAQLGLVML